MGQAWHLLKLRQLDQLMALTLSITENRAGRCNFGLSTLEERRWHFGRRPGVVGVVDLAARERNVQGIRHMEARGDAWQRPAYQLCSPQAG